MPLTDPYATWAGSQSGPTPIWYELDVTTLVAEHVDGMYPNYGIGLAGPEGNQLHYTQREASGSPNIPELVIEYTPIPEPTSALLFGTGLLATCARRRGQLRFDF